MPKSKSSSEETQRIVPGSWTGMIVGSLTVHFGQVVQPTPVGRSVEFTYAIVAAELIGPERRSIMPGVLTIFVPTSMKDTTASAGFVLPCVDGRAAHLNFEVTRTQFSDMLPYVESRRLSSFYFAINEWKDDHWPIQSWGMSTMLPAAQNPV